MRNFADRLITAIKRKHSYIIVGLDPRWDLIPVALKPRSAKTNPPAGEAGQIIARTLLRFNKKIIDIVADSVVGVKPQSAFYEKFGYWGVKAFWETMAYAKKKGLIVIADVKRGDVPSTAQAYAEAYLENSPADAITLNPLLGGDSLAPFISLARRKGKGLFILVKTSNPGSKDFQDRLLQNGQRFYEAVAEKTAVWGKSLIGEKGYSSLGAVAGATFPKETKRLRILMPRQFFLVPGYGAQGGRAKDARLSFNADGLGAIINAARSIIHAYQDPRNKYWTEAVKEAVVRMNRALSL